MATCNCGCEDCTCNTPDNILQYDTQEINQRLFDSIINASVRYSCPNCGIRQFTLSEVLPLVPDKDRTILRIITFLNKDTNPVPEIWQFFGRTLLDWSNVSYWIKLLRNYFVALVLDVSTNFQNKLNAETEERRAEDDRLEQLIKNINIDPSKSYVQSKSVVSVEVVEKAISATDNILYFEYEEMPENSTYSIKVSPENNVVANIETTIPVEIKTYLIGNNGYSQVQVHFELTAKPENATMIGYILKEGTGERYDFTNQGIYPTTPVEISADYEKAIQVTATFSVSGNYNLEVQLVDATTSEVITEVDVPINVN